MWRDGWRKRRKGSRRGAAQLFRRPGVFCLKNSQSPAPAGSFLWPENGPRHMKCPTFGKNWTAIRVAEPQIPPCDCRECCAALQPCAACAALLPLLPQRRDLRVRTLLQAATGDQVQAIPWPSATRPRIGPGNCLRANILPDRGGWPPATGGRPPPAIEAGPPPGACINSLRGAK